MVPHLNQRANVSNPLRKQVTNARMEKLFLAFEMLRLRDREMPGQMAGSFFYVASHEGCHKQALEQALGMSTASGSRNTDLLCDGRVGRVAKGLGLIHKEVDPTNKRRQTLHLTPLGKDLARMILQTIYD